MSLVAEMQSGILRVTARGKATRNFQKQMANIVALNKSDANAVTYILADLRDFSTSMSVIEIEDTMKAVSVSREHYFSRIAILYNPSSPTVVERFKFLENISNLLSFSIKVFVDEALAIEWLNSNRRVT